MSAAFKGRREDLRLVTGKGQYTADWNLPGQAYGHFLRADRAHAEIVSLDSSEALALPGVLGVFTGEDLAKAGYKSPRPLMHFKGKDGAVLKNPHRPALAQGRGTICRRAGRARRCRERDCRAGRRGTHRRGIPRSARDGHARGRDGARRAHAARRCSGQPRPRLRVWQPRRRPKRRLPRLPASCASSCALSASPARRWSRSPLSRPSIPRPDASTSTCRPRACPTS